MQHVKIKIFTLHSYERTLSEIYKEMLTKISVCMSKSAVHSRRYGKGTKISSIEYW